MYMYCLSRDSSTLRRADLHLHVAAIPVVRLDQQQVALERFLAVRAAERQERQQFPSRVRDHVAQLVVGDRGVADELHARTSTFAFSPTWNQTSTSASVSRLTS